MEMDLTKSDASELGVLDSPAPLKNHNHRDAKRKSPGERSHPVGSVWRLRRRERGTAHASGSQGISSLDWDALGTVGAVHTSCGVMDQPLDNPPSSNEAARDPAHAPPHLPNCTAHIPLTLTPPADSAKQPKRAKLTTITPSGTPIKSSSTPSQATPTCSSTPVPSAATPTAAAAGTPPALVELKGSKFVVLQKAMDWSLKASYTQGASDSPGCCRHRAGRRVKS